jgi:hypothetical protein
MTNFMKDLYHTILYFLYYLKWLLNGKPMVKHSGFNCGCCGKRWNIPFEVPTYKSIGIHDEWGLCPEDKGCWKDMKHRKSE